MRSVDVDVDGSPVRLHEAGAGPTVLLLHGSGPGTTGHGAWAATAEALGDSFRLVAPDQAGFGRTPLPAGSTGGMTTWVDQAAGLTTALGVETFSVVGHSMGGAVALGLASAHPSRVVRVVGVSSMGAPGAPLSDDLDALWAAPADAGGARDLLSRLLLDPALVTEPAVAARLAAMQAGASSFSQLFPPPRARWVDDLTLSPRALADVRAPVLLVHGAQDRVTPLETATPTLVEHLADVRLHVIEQCGHVPAVEHPETFRQLLREFLDAG